MTKPVLITGCSSGIGYCVAKGLQERGYRVFATARKPEDVDRLNAEGFESLQLDLDHSDSIQSAFKTIMKRTNGRLYALFNNGAYGQPGAIEDITRDALRQQFETNVFGWHELTNLAIPVMRQQNEGRIIHNSSVLGFVAMPYRGPYNASKYALEGLADTLRLELHNSNIFVSLIEPGPIRSQFRKNARQAFIDNIDVNNSAHQSNYSSLLSRLEKEGDAQPFTLGPEAVLKRVIHALESRRPKVRYCVTFPTYLFATLKRFLTHRGIDKLILKISGGGSR